MKDKKKEWLEKEGLGPPWPHFFTEEDIAKAKEEAESRAKRRHTTGTREKSSPDKGTPSSETRGGPSPFKKKKDQ